VVETLKKDIEQKKEFINQLRADYLNLQKNIDEMVILKDKVRGRSIKDYITENEQLSKQIDELKDKCNRHTDIELMEMKNALDLKPQLEREIEVKSRELIERTNELTRLKGNILELEQMKAQMDLIRTLNDHLRGELERSKMALESRVGEVCPALTEIDVQESQPNSASFISFERRSKFKTSKKNIKTLSELAGHIQQYAASQGEPLFYGIKDIRAFIAGLASSKIAILQGLSGTGKTSLPKIFIEAIDGEKRIVPVESSWRDRNELLGYYNDFNRKFTAKDFTCHLYRAGMPNYSNTPFFIILDEMNLSRVEYYFADFLSILEDKKSNWQVPLVDVDLRSLPSELPDEVIKFIEKDGNSRIKDLKKKIYDQSKLREDNIEQKEKMELINYLSINFKTKDIELRRRLLGGPQRLLEGKKLTISENVWFIGTANRDESTFEISDKVYDRAQVLNFSKRASEIKSKGSIEPNYVSYKMLDEMFNEAIDSHKYDSLTDPLIERIDLHLRDKFKITFGNRIAMQLNKFVPVYIEAGKLPNEKEDDLKREAIDYQLTNKILRKLEYRQIKKENLVELKKTFEDEHFRMATEFVKWKIQNEE